ncbi:hypothetical protein L873DRAFT_1809665 [Choiromyces venosus 120613-1]|uniref:Uncharacterized protein n=1 Tax=Choiromyces venosus 120613-1 TaxID=1336337 RepID=A0A3N4JME6_9PEZI|nr:hypothetical protein L873DRAFT_1809665 [Choiromyces venosus 120613-1]
MCSARRANITAPAGQQRSTVRHDTVVKSGSRSQAKRRSVCVSESGDGYRFGRRASGEAFVFTVAGLLWYGSWVVGLWLVAYPFVL